MTFAWAWGATVVFLASFAIGFAGFGNGLISMALLPFVMAPATAAVIVTGYTIVFALGMFLHLRRDLVLGRITHLLVGTVIGLPFGLWAGMALFARVDRAHFRRSVFGLLLVSGVVLVVRG